MLLMKKKRKDALFLSEAASTFAEPGSRSVSDAGNQSNGFRFLVFVI
jgi:hypothetical protein